MIDRNQVHEGMMVRSSDGKKLGRVLACEDAAFVVEKGFFFATDYVARYDDVTEIAGDELRLSRPQQALAHDEHALAHEGGLGESFTFCIASGLDASPRETPALAADEDEAARRGGVRGDEGEVGSRYDLGADPDATPPSYGDEGGGGR